MDFFAGQILLTIISSRYDELLQEPMVTCWNGSPATSLTSLTLSGEEGQAILGVSELRSSSIISLNPAVPVARFDAPPPGPGWPESVWHDIGREHRGGGA